MGLELSNDVDERELVTLALRVRGYAGAYPPVAPTRDAIHDWLYRPGAAEAKGVERAVARLDGRVVGHVQVGPFWSRALPGFLRQEIGAREAGWAELGRLFVDPHLEGAGIGALLCDWAETTARLRRKDLALCVMDSQAGARALYEKRGWRELGGFDTDTVGPVRVFIAPRVQL